jgi:hypothetical protein
MKIFCRHGYFVFEETHAGQISRFMSLFGLEIESTGDHFTFSSLLDAPDYSLAGGTFFGAPTTEVFAGHPWEIMRVNDLVYNFSLDAVVPIQTVTQVAKVRSAANYFLSDGMLLPGSVMEDGSRVKDYAAFFYFDEMQFKYSELFYE